MADTPTEFFDLPASEFPFAIIAFGADGEIRFSRMVTDTCALHVPGLGTGSITRVIMVTPDGEATDYQPGCVCGETSTRNCPIHGS
jgi:hypothetical protein